jgi:hypothetical protein
MLIAAPIMPTIVTAMNRRSTKSIMNFLAPTQTERPQHGTACAGAAGGQTLEPLTTSRRMAEIRWNRICIG